MKPKPSDGRMARIRTVSQRVDCDLKRADRVARAIVTGNVSINNVMLTEGNHALPFGGAKQSGIGRYKGEFGFYCFANIKSMLVDKNSGKDGGQLVPLHPA
jgi:acyl-CoA reductase-like NAD-dependent aldehyde dehydrogenase